MVSVTLLFCRADGMVGSETIPPGKSFSFRVLLSDWATIDKPDTYTITVTKSSLMFNWAQLNRDSGPKAEGTAKIRIVQADRQKLGELIASLSQQALAEKGNVEEARLALACIKDERTIPTYLKILARRGYDDKFYALEQLGSYDTPEAIAALKSGLKISADDMLAQCTTREVAQSIANNLRVVAVQRLAESKNPEVRKFLLDGRNDPMDEFRLTVVHMLGRSKSEESVRILKEMTKDSYPLVRSEAERYLKEFGSP